MNRPKARGTAAETAVLRYVQQNGWPNAYRKTLSGSKDGGDIQLDQHTIIEVKNVADASTGQPSAAMLNGWLAETQAEVVNSGSRWGLLVVKRKGKSSPADWFCYAPIGTFVGLAHIEDPAWRFDMIACVRFGDVLWAMS